MGAGRCVALLGVPPRLPTFGSMDCGDKWARRKSHLLVSEAVELLLKWSPARAGKINFGGWPSWGAPAPQTPRGVRAGDGMGWEQQRPRRKAPRGRRRRRRPRCCSHPRPGPPGRSGGREPPRKANPPKSMLPVIAADPVLLGTSHLVSSKSVVVGLRSHVGSSHSGSSVDN